MPANLPSEKSINQRLVNVCLLAPQQCHQLSIVHFLNPNLYHLTVVHSLDHFAQSLSATKAERYSIDAIDIVLLSTDLAMGESANAVAYLQTLISNRYVPIVLLSQTDLDDSSILIDAMAAGAHDYIEISAKPSAHAAKLFSAKIASQVRIAAMQTLVQQQNTQIMEYHKNLMLEQQLAEEVFNKVSQNNGIDMANIRHWLSPSAVFNGDVLLAAPTPSGGLIVLLGDFTGHGLAAAIGAIPLASTFYSMVEKGFSMPDIIKELNAKLHAILPVSVFCCASVVQMNFDEGIVDVWNAGLPDTYVLRQHGSSIEAIHSNGLALGIVGAGEYQPKPTRFNLLAGDRLYLLSDGVLEATNHTGEQFGDERLLKVISDQVNANTENGFASIKQQVIDFIGEHSPADDISLVELTMVNAADFAAMYQSTQQTITAEPVSWHFSYELRPDSLRYQDPVPLLLHLLMEVPTLRRYSGQLFIIMTELYNNALEHGLLGLSSALKQAPDGFKSYYNTRNDQLHALQQGSVAFTLDYQGNDKQGLLVIDVVDSGKGFDHAALASLRLPLDENLQQSQPVLSGRGIPLLQSICSKVEYLGVGNHARVAFKWTV